MTTEEIALFRLCSQKPIESESMSPGQMVQHMGAMQSQDFGMAKWAVGIRCPSSVIHTVDDALDSGDIIRTHVLRPTWHFVSSADIRWMLELSAPHIRASLKYRHHQLELTGEMISKSNEIIGRTLQQREFATRPELKDALVRAGFSTGNNRIAHLFLLAELDMLICSGKSRGQEPTWTLMSNRIPPAPSLPAEEALARLAGKYFLSHGPATLRDFTWWSGLTIREARKGLENVKHEFDSAICQGDEYWFVPPPEIKPEKKSVHLLPAYDELVISYRNRSAILTSARAQQVVSSNGFFRPVILVDGKAKGTWKWKKNKGKLHLEAAFFEKSGSEVIEKLKQKAEKFAAFTGMEAETEITMENIQPPLSQS